MSETTNELAQRTITTIQEALREQDTACVAQIVELIREITSNPDEISVQHLADMVKRDLTVTTRLLGAANTLGYNPDGTNITNIEQAIQVVGFLKIRNLAVSLLLLTNAPGAARSRECGNISTAAVASGYIAQTLMEQRQFPDPEMAFVCAALRHYGQLLEGTFMPDHFRRASLRTQEVGMERAQHEIFGLTPLELAHHILKDARLPAPILNCVKAFVRPASPTGKLSATEQLVAVCDFSAKMGELLVTNSSGPDELAREMGVLCTRYDPPLKLTGKLMNGVLAETNHRLGAFRGLLSIGPVMRKLDSLIARADAPPEAAAVAPVSQAAPASPPAREQSAETALARGTEQISDLLGHTPLDLRGIFMTTASTLQAALNLGGCWIFWKRAQGSVLEARLGVGGLFDGLRDKAVLDPAQKTIFSVCFERGDMVLLPRPDDARILPFVPPWLRHVARGNGFIMLPLRNADGTFAIIFGHSTDPESGSLATRYKQQVGVICRLLSITRPPEKRQDFGL
jgi:HD-like signal output (HDOD) protein